MTLVFLLLVTPLISGAIGLKNVSLKILPPAVERGMEATLLCQYDLEDAPLYAVKWYRGTREFYRYSPNDNPPTKIFPYQGIHVDVSMSNASQVVLRQVGFNLSGNLSCEVTTDAPSFSTALVSKELMVIEICSVRDIVDEDLVILQPTIRRSARSIYNYNPRHSPELPKRGPTILTEKERYDVGDILRGNCTSSPSRPPATLNVYINNIPVSQPDIQFVNPGTGLQTSVLKLELRVEPAHMSSNSQLTLRCLAHVGNLNPQTYELSLGPRTSEPVPERVTSASHGSSRATCHALTLLFVGWALGHR